MAPSLMETPLVVVDWGRLEYETAFSRQQDMVSGLLAGTIRDNLILVEHPPTVTLGRRATGADLHCSEQALRAQGVVLQRINRGGLATAHEPGQLVAYPITRLKRHDVRWFADSFLNVVVSVLADFGVKGELKQGEPGVWVNGKKICSFGIALKKWISSHGIAVNINNSLATFNLIVPCGRPREVVTSLRQELGHEVDMNLVKKRFVGHFCTAFAYRAAACTANEKTGEEYALS